MNCKPVHSSHNCDKDEDQVPCKEEESSSREVTESPTKMKHFGCNFRYFKALGFCSLYNKSFVSELGN
ncbi:hypothetical protein RchiOBHm_Chr6g0310981 [Rosa chinensis]|uniref:Uncharacterized protein n=1 Tax=Rosa chinensis TaxID=74649 RepID=A0A2P6Q1A6_ROSCH|nr:hypothetical protein RchiOBHm_Chr6g0310981 [Rosa chinensis]